MPDEEKSVAWIVTPLLLILVIGVIALAWALRAIPWWVAAVLLPLGMVGLWRSVPSGPGKG
jgi:hypothetical protein